MSENKCCGNCKNFKDEDAVGWGRCVGHMKEFGVHCSHTGCLEHKFVKNAINGWTEISPDNVNEVDCVEQEKVVIGWLDNKGRQHIAALVDCLPVKSSLAGRGYYYYVLPELKIE